MFSKTNNMISYFALKTFELIKTVSDTVLGITTAVYRDKPSMLIEATFQKKLVSIIGQWKKQIPVHLYGV